MSKETVNGRADTVYYDIKLNLLFSAAALSLFFLLESIYTSTPAAHILTAATT